MAAGVLLAPLALRAQLNRPTVTPGRAELPQGVSSRKVPMLDRRLGLEQFLAMAPDAALKGKLAAVSGFVQNSPSNGKSPTEQTEVYLGRTRTTLEIAFVCFDSRPVEIRRHLARRENILTDDTVEVLLDPFADRRHGVLFQVNALGVQADAAWSETDDPDYSYDQVWNSAAAMTAKGWIAVLSIPFASIRFRAGGLPWGVVLMRNLPRNSETDTWPAISANVSGTLSQEGTLLGIEGVTGSHNVQLNPYGLLQNEHDLNQLNANDPFFSSRKLAGTVGGDAKVVLHDTLVLDATINPDFSQVESDQPQFTVNQRYAVYFPELRPFFLENATYFATPIQLLYTRNIVHPELGARLTGKVGRTNIGLLLIDDREPGEALGPGDLGYGEKAVFGIGRVSEDIGKNSSVGAMYTDEEFAGSWNRIGGVDFTAQLNPKWAVYGQGVESSTRGVDGSYAAGPAYKLQVVRQGHALNLRNTYRDFSQGFQTQAGFLTTTAFRQDQHHAQYQWFPKRGKLQSFGLEESGQFAFDRLGNRLYHYNTFDPFFLLARNTVIAPLIGENSDTLGPASYPVLSEHKNLTENFVGGVLRSAPISQLSINLNSTFGGNPNYNPVAGAPPSLLHENYLQALVTVQPIGSLTIDNTYLLDRNFSAKTGVFTFENQVLRTKWNYQFTRALSARVIVEYDSLLVNPVETSLVRTKEVQTQALLTWLPHPGTAVYLGYNNDLQNLDHQLCSRQDGVCDPAQPVLQHGPGYLNSGRQFFLKASYLLRW